MAICLPQRPPECEKLVSEGDGTLCPSKLSTKPGIFVVGHHFRGGSKAHQGELPSGSVAKNPPATQETQERPVRSLGRENPLEEEVATHSSILALRVPWTEKPGGLQSGSHTESESVTTECAHAERSLQRPDTSVPLPGPRVHPWKLREGQDTGVFLVIPALSSKYFQSQ